MIIETNKFEIRKLEGYSVSFQQSFKSAAEVDSFGYVNLVNTDERTEIYFKNITSGYHVCCIFMNSKGELTRIPLKKDKIQETFERLQWILEGEKWVFDKNGFLLRTYKLLS